MGQLAAVQGALIDAGADLVDKMDVLDVMGLPVDLEDVSVDLEGALVE